MDSQWQKGFVPMNFKRLLGAGLLVAAVGGSGFTVASEHQSGEADFKNYCASCHGASGVGDGPVAGSLKNPPADLTALAAANSGTFPKKKVKDIVQGNKDYDKKFRTHGPADMPVWGNVLYEDSDDRKSIANARINNLVSYIESIQK
ncbi:MAG: cytochrome c [Gammaproteobacteria bacterium]|nr:cytochrome c [Gammaproteobacteria bacterium]MBQ0840172.1 cytochrome c [Gammaproteobacteria bacterium]